MTAVIYARYSSDNQREESIEGQIREYLIQTPDTVQPLFIELVGMQKTSVGIDTAVLWNAV